MKKVISFSLWCQDTKLDPKNPSQNKNMYIQGAYHNLELKKEIYKDWTFRFYVNNTVPQDIQEEIVRRGGEIIDMSNSKIPGMYWRFLAIEDPTVDLFIVRDVDSRISEREELSVNDWIKSDKVMHVLRDHPHHYYKILGGMWGYKNYKENSILNNKYRLKFNEMLNNFLKSKKFNFKRMEDMYFMDQVYDILEQHNCVLAHDNFFKISKNTLRFPNHENFIKDNYYHYVGEIFDENNNPTNIARDKKLQNNYKTTMQGHWSSQHWV